MIGMESGVRLLVNKVWPRDDSYITPRWHATDDEVRQPNVEPHWNVLINVVAQKVSAKIYATQLFQKTCIEPDNTLPFLSFLCEISGQLDRCERRKITEYSNLQKTFEEMSSSDRDEVVSKRDLIGRSSPKEKAILHQVYLKLRNEAVNFALINSFDLKVATLLFGIKKVRKYVANQAQLVNLNSDLRVAIQKKERLCNKLVQVRFFRFANASELPNHFRNQGFNKPRNQLSEDEIKMFHQVETLYTINHFELRLLQAQQQLLRA